MCLISEGIAATGTAAHVRTTRNKNNVTIMTRSAIVSPAI
jgi:hypothetical protein